MTKKLFMEMIHYNDYPLNDSSLILLYMYTG